MTDKLGAPRHLKVVPFSGTDYSLGESLLERDGTSTKDSLGISNKLSLLFQWPEHAWVGVNFVGLGKETLPCKLSYDLDEAVPTELYLTLSGDYTAERMALLKQANVSFEIFRVCYDFRAEVLAANSPALGQLILVLGIPEELITVKHRRLPRIRIDEVEAAKLPYLTIHGQEVTVSELGLNSMALAKNVQVPEGSVELVFQIEPPLRLNAHLLARCGRQVLRLEFRDDLEYGRYFDIYRVFAYPGLYPKSEFSTESLIELYEKTGYFEGFQAELNREQRHKEFDQVWQSVYSAQHDTTADYVATDANKKPVGASSATLAFRGDGQDYWVFQQLCSIKSPDLLLSSGQLYTWRAEYLTGRRQDFKIIFWFRSASRWLDRIYVKFSKQTAEQTTLIPVRITKHRVDRANENQIKGDQLIQYKIGNHERRTMVTPRLVGGIGPELLNASGILNIVSCLGEKTEQSEIEHTAKALINTGDSKTTEIFFCVPNNLKDSDSSLKVYPSDRFCVFSKCNLFDFLTCVEHSIAVTRRKTKAA